MLMNKREEWEEVCRQCRVYDINKDIGHCAANSSNTNVDTSYSCPCGRSFRRPGDLTRHRRFCDGAQHQQHQKATEKRPTHLTAGVEELSTGKETVHDIPTTAPTVLSDLLLVNIQGIVPQDTAIILKMGGYKVTRLQGVCVCVCVCMMALSFHLMPTDFLFKHRRAVKCCYILCKCCKFCLPNLKSHS